MNHWESDPNVTRSVPVRAAQYVRMSTEHQKYSTENQADIIRVYAEARGFEIVQTYADQGKSGLKIEGRDALKRLLADVQAGRADYKVILVYDVSRWGRFQDADESAYYEYLCREAGISVHYCAEQFENDGSLTATIIKGMKRAMAGEYSRELSAKVFTGQCRLIGLGYRQGGPAGFGLRRQLVDEQRRPKALLDRGEHKSLQTDRVILTAGPQDEIDIVQRIYRMFVLQRRSEREIAVRLNAEGVLTDLDRPWTRGTVHQVLTNEKYIGNNVYNRVSFKLKKKRVVNGPDRWVRADGAFEGIVDPECFVAAQRIIADRTRRFTDEQLLDRLTVLLGEKGCLSGLLIDEVEDMPSSSTYRHRFGTLLRAYQLVGYSPDRDYRFLETNRVLRALHPEVVARTIAEVERLGGAIRIDPATDLLTVNEEFTVSVTVIRCSRTSTGGLRWKVRLDAGLKPDITIAVRMDADNTGVRDYYAIGRMLKGNLGIPAMARALGYAEIDVKRLAVLSALPEDALTALRTGRLNLRQARLLARLTDPDEQADLARMALDGHGFQEWRIKERLEQDRVTTRDPRWGLVGPTRYAEAGGRMETDLFGEMEPALLDSSFLTRLWVQRAREIALAFEEKGLAVHVAAGEPPVLPEDLETLGYVYGGMLPADEMAAYRDLRDRFDVVSETVNEVLEATTEAEPVDQAVSAMIQARLLMDQAGWGGRQVTTLVLTPAVRTGVSVQCYSPAVSESEDGTESGQEEAEPVSTMTSVHQASAYPAPDPEIDGVGHALHAIRTDVATRGLVRALAEDPEAAFTALIAHLFGQVASRPFGPRPQSALAINASAFRPKGGRVVEALDGEIRQRLDLRRADWEASGQTVIAWVHGLAQPDRMALLAELTALTLDLREERTSLVQRGARSQAAELADLCGADITRHWTPDADFLKPHARSHLLGMLEAMGARDVHAEGLKKSDLISRVEAMAAEKAWAPGSLSGRVPPMGEGSEAEAGEGAGERTETPDVPGGAEDGDDDGAGAFEVTTDGEAELGVAA